MDDQVKPNLVVKVFMACQELENESDTSDSDEEIILSFMCKSGNLEKTTPRRINLYIEQVVVNYNETEFQSHFRMTRKCFNVLLKHVGPDLLRKGQVGRRSVNPEKQLLAFIWLLATPDSFRSVGDRFNLAKSTLSVIFDRVIQAITAKSKIVIRWPSPVNSGDIQRQFCGFAGVPNVAIDGTYIPIKAPQKDPEVYITRKCQYSITLQAICVPSLKFTDVFVGYPGSVSDTRIFKNSDIYKTIQQHREMYLPNNTILLGDKAYPILEWLVPPFVDRGTLTNRQKLFNQKHAQTRQIIERAFALLFGRFRRLKFLDMNRLEQIPHCVLAACILHNICLDHSNLDDNLIDEGYIYVQGNDNAEMQEDIHINDLNLGKIRRNVLVNDVLNL